MKNELEQKIVNFANSRENQDHALAMLAVGRDEEHDAQTIMKTVIADILLRFHGIQITKPNS